VLKICSEPVHVLKGITDSILQPGFSCQVSCGDLADFWPVLDLPGSFFNYCLEICTPAEAGEVSRGKYGK